MAIPRLCIKPDSFRDEARFGNHKMQYKLPSAEKLILDLYKYWVNVYDIELWAKRNGKRQPYEKFISAHILYVRGFKVAFIAIALGVPRTSIYYMLKAHGIYVQSDFEYQFFLIKCLDKIIRDEYGDGYNIKLKPIDL